MHTPNEVLFDVFAFIDGQQVQRVRAVSKKWFKLIERRREMLPRILIEGQLRIKDHEVKHDKLDLYTSNSELTKFVIFENVCLHLELNEVEPNSYQALDWLLDECQGRIRAKNLKIQLIGNHGPFKHHHRKTIDELFMAENLLVQPYTGRENELLTDPELLNFSSADKISVSRLEVIPMTTTEQVLDFLFRPLHASKGDVRLSLGGAYENFMDEFLVRFEKSSNIEAVFKCINIFAHESLVMSWLGALSRWAAFKGYRKYTDYYYGTIPHDEELQVFERARRDSAKMVVFYGRNMGNRFKIFTLKAGETLPDECYTLAIAKK